MEILKGGEDVTSNKNRENLPEKHKVVADSIRVGKENATLLSDIMIIADIDDRRQAHTIIEQLINNYGYVIGANRTGKFKGYYKPANDREFLEIASTFKKTVNSMNKRYNNLLINYSKLGA